MRGVRRGFVGREGDFTFGNGDAIGVKQGFRLIFVDVHGQRLKQIGCADAKPSGTPRMFPMFAVTG
jgi:hypothetical protein